jgi:hypothetical protein
MQEFPKRKLSCGKQVRSFEDFIVWLTAKHPAIKTDILDFDGKNQVLWWIPEE